MVCINCKCPDNSEDAVYCHNCGILLNGNFCSNPDCQMNNSDEPIPLDPTHCYCEVCGGEAEYFKLGYAKTQSYT